jgi:Tol biopolymer transport system component
MIPDALDLSRDGQKLAFVAFRTTGEDKQLWSTSIGAENGKVLSVGNYRFPTWSRDGMRLACRKAANVGTKSRPMFSFQVVLIPLEGGEEQVLNSPVFGGANNPNDWSKDGEWILVSCRRGSHSANDASTGVERERPSSHICLQPVMAAPRAEEQARIIASHSDYDLWQPRFSPDDRWILFNAVERRGAQSSRLFVVDAKGGDWKAITDGKYWADKAIWAPDGRIIFYTTNRGGFFNIWGIRFDPVEGRALGEPYQVTQLDSPNRQIDPDMVRTEIGVSSDQLALQTMEVTGNIWVLHDVP